MARTTVFSDDVGIYVDETEVADLLHHMIIATGYPGIKEWMHDEAAPWLQERLEHRFGEEGDDASGAWDDLSLTTRRIRHEEGFPAAHPINVRTGSLRRWLVGAEEKVVPRGSSGDGASMTFPGDDPPDTQTKKKLKVAQRGEAHNAMFAGAYTPARPVLAVNEVDLEVLLLSYADWFYEYMSAHMGTL